MLTQCENWAFLEAHTAKNLGRLEGEKEVCVPFKACKETPILK